MRAWTGGAVYSMEDPHAPPAEAIAVDGGRVVAVGRADDVIGRAGPGCEVIDARGRAIVPGFVDAHHHMCLAVFYEGCTPCGPDVCPTIDALCETLRRASADLPRDAWVLGQGYDDAALGRHPTRAELDDACGGRPVLLLHYSCHEGVASSRALALGGVDERTADPPGGVIARDARGVPSGRLIELAMSRVEVIAREAQLARGERDWVERLATYQQRLFAAGITRVADPHVSPDFERAYRRARDEGKLRIPLLRMVSSGAGFFSPPVDRLGELRTGEGPEDFRVGPMKLVFDGANRCAMCVSIPNGLLTAARGVAHAIRRGSFAALRAVRESGSRFSRGNVETGILFYEEDAGRAMVARARDAGYGIAIHAIGNLAIARAVDAIGRSGAAVEGFAPRIEHATLTTPSDVARLRDLGAIVVAQPPFLRISGLADAPIPLGFKALAFKSLRDAGIVVAGSSDAPVVTFDVLFALRAALSRRTSAGRTLHADEALDVRDALAMYTRDAARACGALDVTGTLAPGKRADLVVLSSDPMAGGLDGARVAETWLAGERVFAAA